MKSDFAHILDALKQADSFLIAAHIRPDGDAVGSVLALRLLLAALGKTDVQCAIDGSVPRIYEFLPGADQFRVADEIEPRFECAVMLDTGRRNRLGTVEPLVAEANQVLVVDHHLDSAPEGDLCVADSSYSATGEMIVELYELAGVAIGPEAATCLYTAIATDTGGFRFSNTNARCHRTAARLIETGVDVEGISVRVFDAMSRGRLNVLRLYLDKLDFFCDGRVAVVSIAEEDMASAEAVDGDLENLVNLGRNIDGVEVSVLFRELASGQTKVSLRSRPTFNVKRVAEQFGGGGHAAAAGASLDAPMDEARKAVIATIEGAF